MSDTKSDGNGNELGRANLARYNELLVEAKALGLTGYRPISQYTEVAMAKKRIEMLESSIKAHKAGEKSDKADRSKPKATETTPMATSAKRKTTAAAPAPKGKKGAAPAPGKKGTAAPAPKAAAAPKKETATVLAYKPGTAVKLDDLPAAVLGSRVNSKKGALLAFLIKNFKQPVSMARCLKAVYGSDADAEAQMGAFTIRVQDLINGVTKLRVPYTIEKSTEGKETTLALLPVSK